MEEAFKDALEWFKKLFNSNFSPEFEVGDYDEAWDLSFKGRKILVNKSKLFEYIEKLNSSLQLMYGKRNDERKEIVARLVHEITEAYLHSEEGIGLAIKVFPFFHEFADWIEDLYRRENGLMFHAHGYRWVGLEKIFEKIFYSRRNKLM